MPVDVPPSSPPAAPPDVADDAGLNRFQRAYFAWAEPYYQRLEEPYRSEGRRMDRFLYSRRGLGVWAGSLLAMAASAAGLHSAGFPWPLALFCSVAVWFSILLAAGSAWLMPDRFTPRRLIRRGLLTAFMAFAGALVGFLVARATRTGGLALETLGGALWQAAQRAAPVLALVVCAILLLTWAVAQWRRKQTQQELARLRLVQERDASARQIAEARLKLLQAQIQPHFIFNTLAALQHWVDSGDARAGALLRALTGFLRGSTELLGQPHTTLATELELVRQYLAIMQARLGERLGAQLDCAPDCADVRLPPGLLLTLVENAVEHGVAPALSGGVVSVTAWRADGRVILRVADDGAGLAPDWAEGVGLANCRERLQHHGDGSGSLSLRRLPQGAEALLNLPGALPA